MNVAISTLKVLAGPYKKAALDEAMEWASKPENRALLEMKWKELNERD